MKRFYLLVALVGTSAMTTAQTVLTQWNFDNESTTPNVGSGVITSIGVTGSESYVGGKPASGKALTIAGFPAQGTSSGTAGLQFMVSTTGRTAISNFDGFGRF